MIVNKEKNEMKSLASVTNGLLRDGFTENFIVSEKGLVAPSADKIYQPADVKIVNFYRFEGESDPADNSILYAIETNDGVKGTLSDAFGAYADSKVLKFIDQVQEIMKNTDINPKS